MKLLPSKMFPDCDLSAEQQGLGGLMFFSTPDGFENEIHIFLGPGTLEDEIAIEKAAEFFDKISHWDIFCRELFRTSDNEEIENYFNFYKKESPDVFNVEDVLSLSLSDMVNSLVLEGMAAHETGDKEHYVVDFTLGYDQVLCVYFDNNFDVKNIAWES